MKTRNMLLPVLMSICVSCMHAAHRSEKSTPEQRAEVRIQFGVPDGVLLAIVQSPRQDALTSSVNHLDSAILRLNAILDQNEVQYRMLEGGYLNNQYYIYTDHDRARRLFTETLKKECLEVEFY